MKKIEIDSLKGLERVAQALLDSLAGRSVVLLNGEMGAGKTTLVRAILEVLGSKDSVSSPTFAIINEYLTESMDSVYHFDMYRIENPSEALDFGVEEYLSSGSLCLVEWPERIEALLPEDAMRVNIEVNSPSHRTFTIE